jgi:hypothetical protein
VAKSAVPLTAISDPRAVQCRARDSWRGIAALAATRGVLLAPEQLDAVYKTFIAILGPAAVVSPGRKSA